MKVENPSIEIISNTSYKEACKLVSSAGRICYKSKGPEGGSSVEQMENFIRQRIRDGHESIIEHFSVSVKITCSRGASHELVRHRIASYSQESTRYCNYAKDKFGNEITVISPRGIFKVLSDDQYRIWENACLDAEKHYLRLIDQGATPDVARGVLPNSLKTTIMTTMNMREWRHFFRLRCAREAHYEIREIALLILDQFRTLYPVFVNDLAYIIPGVIAGASTACEVMHMDVD